MEIAVNPFASFGTQAISLDIESHGGWSDDVTKATFLQVRAIQAILQPFYDKNTGTTPYCYLNKCESGFVYKHRGGCAKMGKVTDCSNTDGNYECCVTTRMTKGFSFISQVPRTLTYDDGETCSDTDGQWVGEGLRNADNTDSNRDICRMSQSYSIHSSSTYDNGGDGWSLFWREDSDSSARIRRLANPRGLWNYGDIQTVEFRQNSPDWKPGDVPFTHTITWVGLTGEHADCVLTDPQSCTLKITKTFQFHTDQRFVTVSVTLENRNDLPMYDIWYSHITSNHDAETWVEYQGTNHPNKDYSSDVNEVRPNQALIMSKGNVQAETWKVMGVGMDHPNARVAHGKSSVSFDETKKTWNAASWKRGQGAEKTENPPKHSGDYNPSTVLNLVFTTSKLDAGGSESFDFTYILAASAMTQAMDNLQSLVIVAPSDTVAQCDRSKIVLACTLMAGVSVNSVIFQVFKDGILKSTTAVSEPLAKTNGRTFVTPPQDWTQFGTKKGESLAVVVTANDDSSQYKYTKTKSIIVVKTEDQTRRRMSSGEEARRLWSKRTLKPRTRRRLKWGRRRRRAAVSKPIPNDVYRSTVPSEGVCLSMHCTAGPTARIKNPTFINGKWNEIPITSHKYMKPSGWNTYSRTWLGFAIIGDQSAPLGIFTGSGASHYLAIRGRDAEISQTVKHLPKDKNLVLKFFVACSNTKLNGDIEINTISSLAEEIIIPQKSVDMSPAKMAVIINGVVKGTYRCGDLPSKEIFHPKEISFNPDDAGIATFAFKNVSPLGPGNQILLDSPTIGTKKGSTFELLTSGSTIGSGCGNFLKTTTAADRTLFTVKHVSGSNFFHADWFIEWRTTDGRTLSSSLPLCAIDSTEYFGHPDYEHPYQKGVYTTGTLQSYSTVKKIHYSRRRWAATYNNGQLGSLQAWVAGLNTLLQWYQIDLGSSQTVTGFVTQRAGGYPSSHGVGWTPSETTTSYVTSYKIAHATDKETFTTMPQVWSAEAPAGAPLSYKTVNVPSSPILARYIRFYVQKWVGNIYLRAGVIVAEDKEVRCTPDFSNIPVGT